LCEIKAMNFILAPILAAFGAGMQVQSIFDAIENGDYDLAAVRKAH